MISTFMTFDEKDNLHSETKSSLGSGVFAVVEAEECGAYKQAHAGPSTTWVLLV